MVKALALLLICAIPCTAAAQGAAAQGPANAPADVSAPAPAAPSARPLVNEDTSFKSLFTQVPPAFKRLGSKGSLAVLGVGVLVAGVVSNSDDALTRHASNSVRFDHNLLAGHALGDIYFQGSVSLGTYLAGYAARSPRTMLLGADLIRAQLMSGFLTDVTKVIVQRERPNGANYSFPSGHTTSAFASATVLQQHFGLKVGIPAYLVGAYVAVSRMADDRHYPSDLVIGAAIGVASAHSLTVERGRNRMVIAPMAVPGGGGVSVSLAD